MKPNTLLALSLLRELWQGFDSGGHSGRSVRAQLVEAIFSFMQGTLPEVNTTFAGLQELTKKACDEPVQLSLPELHLVDTETFICLVACKLLEETRALDPPTKRETHILECAALLLAAEKHVVHFSTDGLVIFSLEELIWEGRYFRAPRPL